MLIMYAHSTTRKLVLSITPEEYEIRHSSCFSLFFMNIFVTFDM